MAPECIMSRTDCSDPRPSRHASPVIPALVVMGVSGCGKSTVAARAAGELGWAFLEGDTLHPEANVERMRQGQPLDDAARAPWLRAIAAWIASQRAAGQGSVIACSALRRSYRDVLRDGNAALRFAWLHVTEAVLRERLQARRGHFMPASLLHSQLRTLEPPGADEAALRLEAADGLEANVAAAVRFARDALI